MARQATRKLGGGGRGDGTKSTPSFSPSPRPWDMFSDKEEKAGLWLKDYPTKVFSLPAQAFSSGKPAVGKIRRIIKKKLIKDFFCRDFVSILLLSFFFLLLILAKGGKRRTEDRILEMEEPCAN